MSTTSPEASEREAFEAWALEKHYAYRDKNGIWFYDFSEPLWRGWQGGRAALRAPKVEAPTTCRQCAAKQAQIDRLMLEYCPDEMTPEQMEEWARNQRPGQESAALLAALSHPLPALAPLPDAQIDQWSEEAARAEIPQGWAWDEFHAHFVARKAWAAALAPLQVDNKPQG
jgi:hypothetical protein